jgi:hypothetical protein
MSRWKSWTPVYMALVRLTEHRIIGGLSGRKSCLFSLNSFFSVENRFYFIILISLVCVGPLFAVMLDKRSFCAVVGGKSDSMLAPWWHFVKKGKIERSRSLRTLHRLVRKISTKVSNLDVESFGTSRPDSTPLSVLRRARKPEALVGFFC